ncbi:hypothetical protein ACPCA8_23490 [Streptomyces capoamus]|uniref:hypothetical protein n=1 Tax=Streptomyces capoamus TaxID=68183 RepID=UPI003C2C13DD
MTYGFTTSASDEAAMQGICFDEETELLTSEGWKPFPEVRGDEQVLTLNGDTAEWGSITKMIRAPFDGDLNLHDGDRVNFCITHNHRLLASPMHYRKPDQTLCRYCDRSVGAKGIARHEGTHQRRGDEMIRPQRQPAGEPVRRWHLAEYQDLPQEFFIRRTNTWRGHSPDTVTFDAPAPARNQKPHHQVARTFAFKDWAAFLGWFVAEGWTTGDGRNNRIGIAQNPGEKYEEIAALLDRMGLPYSRHAKSLIFFSAPIAAWLREHCGVGSENKRIPHSIREATPEMIEAFLDAFGKGDGAQHTHADSRRYITSSRQLADDLHEVLCKVGRARKLRIMHAEGSEGTGPQGKIFQRRRATWMINEAGRPADSNVSKKNVVKHRYTGTVYCASTPHETIMVRRKGCPMWSGNSSDLLSVVDEAGGIARPIGDGTNR